jgi:hypothetical protein
MSASAAADEKKDACALLRDAEVKSALRTKVDPGHPIDQPDSCVWRAAGHPTGIAENVIVYLIDATRFEQMKSKVSESPQAQQSGVGDEAFYFRPMRAPIALVVKKGEQYFQVMARTHAPTSPQPNPGELPPGSQQPASMPPPPSDDDKLAEVTLARQILKRL